MGYGKNLNYRMPNKAVEATPNGPPHFYDLQNNQRKVSHGVTETRR